MKGLQLNLINVVLFFTILSFTESVNRAIMKETRAGTHVSVLFGHEGSFPVCILSRMNRSNSSMVKSKTLNGLRKSLV